MFIIIQEVVEGLKARGHKVVPMTGWSVLQAVQAKDDVIVAVSDFRKGGKPDGY